MTSEAEYNEIEIQTSVGSFLPLVRRLVRPLKTLQNPHNGYVEISFEYDGIRIEYSEFRNLVIAVGISEEFIPRDQIGAFASLYEDDQYVEYYARRLTYGDLEELDIWLSGFSPDQRVTVCLEADEQDVGILIGCSLRGIKNYYGYSECHRPERRE